MTIGNMIMNLSPQVINRSESGSNSSKGNTNVSSSSDSNFQANSKNGFSEMLSQANDNQKVTKSANAVNKQSKLTGATDPSTDIEQLLALIQSVQDLVLQLQKLFNKNSFSGLNNKQNGNVIISEATDDVTGVLGQLKQNLKNFFQGQSTQSNSSQLNITGNSLNQLKQHLLDLQGLMKSSIDNESNPALAQFNSSVLEKNDSIEPAIQNVLRSIQDWQNLSSQTMQMQAGLNFINPLKEFPDNELDSTAQMSSGNRTAFKNGFATESDNQKNSSNVKSVNNSDNLVFFSGQTQHLNNLFPNLPEKIPISTFAQTLQQYIDPTVLKQGSGTLQTAADGSFQFHIKLIPEGLGEVQLTISGGNSQMSVQMVTASDQARQLLDAQSGQLRELLSAKGINCDNIQVSSGDFAGGFFSQSGNQQNPNWHNHSNGKNAKSLSGITSEMMDGSSYEPILHQQLGGSLNTQYPNVGTSSVIDTMA